ncbi:MAG: heparan-alpha-glucosaminide N-acetyltransferase domain-containing protein [Azospirillaceae bacterium]|nr:heparan-alpha-glucosaminide N-acetyltransferase domain-containing protein [Azospirillaceae bacterium]
MTVTAIAAPALAGAGAKIRLASLDVLRGLAVAGMILVTSPGDWDKYYAQLKHAAWNGWTLADMVAPGFLFGIGLAIALSFPRMAADPAAAARQIGRRALSLILLGLFLNALPAFDLAHLRLPGILQRIALCYALVAGLCLLTRRQGADGAPALNLGAVAGAIAVLLLGSWAALVWIPVPGFGPGQLDPDGNLFAWIDRQVFTVPHLWPYGTNAAGLVTYDPDGLPSTLPASANVAMGVLAGAFLKRTDRKSVLLTVGLALMGTGLALDPVLPINKRLWTASFALFSGGFSLTTLMLLSALLDRPAVHPGWSAAAYPCRVLGGNAILAFSLSQVLDALGGLPLIPTTEGPLTPQAWGYRLVGRVVTEPYLASFICALGILALIIALLVPLHRRGLHVRL